PKRGNFQVKRTGAQPLFRILWSAGNSAILLVQEKIGEMLQRDFGPTPNPLLPRPTSEPAEQRSVGLLGVLCLPALIAQVLQKILHQVLHGNYNSSPVRRRNASRYFALVFCTTSGGSAGAGGVLSQSRVSR